VKLTIKQEILMHDVSQFWKDAKKRRLRNKNFFSDNRKMLLEALAIIEKLNEKELEELFLEFPEVEDALSLFPG